MKKFTKMDKKRIAGRQLEDTAMRLATDEDVEGEADESSVITVAR